MKLCDLRVDVDAIEHGAWIDHVPNLPGVAFKVRGWSAKEVRAVTRREIDRLRAGRRRAAELTAAQSEAVQAIAALEAGLIDWRGFEDDAGAPLPYSLDQARVFMTDPAYQLVREGIVFAMSEAGRAEAEEAAADRGN